MVKLSSTYKAPDGGKKVRISLNQTVIVPLNRFLFFDEETGYDIVPENAAEIIERLQKYAINDDDIITELVYEWEVFLGQENVKWDLEILDWGG